VTDNPRFFFLTSGGKLIDTREGYYKFHEDWFSEKEWEISFELLEAHEGKDYGYTNAIYRYRGITSDGGAYGIDSYFNLIFHKEEGQWKVVSDVCTPISRYYSDSRNGEKYSQEQEFIFRTIRQRRTVRQFKSTPVPREHILKILDAARFAPTAGNQQPWKFLVIQDRGKIQQLKTEALGWYLDLYKKNRNPGQEELDSLQERIKKVLENVLSAPVYIAVLADSHEKYPDYVMTDGTLAAGQLMIAARALGYGTGFFTTFFPEEPMKKFFGIPDQFKLICLTPIGIPEKWPETPSKKELESMVIFDSF
jgi:nitroreductase/ketosteroid isomerase-like protein